MKDRPHIIIKQRRSTLERTPPLSSEEYRCVNLRSRWQSTYVTACHFTNEAAHAIGDWAAQSVREDGASPEVGGLLLGYVATSDDCVVYVDRFQPFREVDFANNSLLVVSDAIRQAYEAGTSDRPGLIVGWFHTHPGHGPYLSTTDVNRTHLPFFRHPYQIALVLDPHTPRWDTGIFSTLADQTGLNTGRDTAQFYSSKEVATGAAVSAVFSWKDLLAFFS
ncbi:Mov34/MPN/PAD-1 family protein [Lewinella sp. W8]|uniref:Mov34/MPN/PAD-1 family protein n=1 Tax=Lewinella sp. W8 TaxID=2528208 RepID=UPI0010681587|nr:Mov34/MPN/PAD-1 family protein [Lewinella sp. W8]MTB52925.1 hypothetical protein [Lewinella sp. W8]